MYREDNMGPEIYHIFIVCGIIAKEWRKEMSNAPKNKEIQDKMKLGIVINQPFFINLCTSIKVRKTAWLQGFLKKQKHKAPCKIT